MLQYLLVFFLILPTGVGTVKQPYKTIEECQTKAAELVALAKQNNVPVIGTCVGQEDFLASR